MTEYMTAGQAAEHLGVSASQVRRYCENGLLPATKLGRDWLIRQEEIQAFRRPPKGARRGKQMWYAASYYYGRGMVESATGREIRSLQAWPTRAERDAWVAQDAERDVIVSTDRELRRILRAVRRFDAGDRDAETCRLAEIGLGMYEH